MNEEPETVAVTLPAGLLRRLDRELRFKRRGAGHVSRESLIREAIRAYIEGRRDTRRQDADAETVQRVARPAPKRRLYPCADPNHPTDLS